MRSRCVADHERLFIISLYHDMDLIPKGAVIKVFKRDDDMV